MTFENFMLVFVGGLAALAAVGVVAMRQTLYSALCLVLNVAMLAVMYLILNAQFLFAVQLIVYAGAVMVLFVFIIALLSPGTDARPALDSRFIIGLLGVAVITMSVGYLANSSTRTATAGDCPNSGASATCLSGASNGRFNDPYHSFTFDYQSVNDSSHGGGNVQTVGGQLFTTFLLPFEITSLLLFVAAIGAVYLTRREKPAKRRRSLQQ